MVRRGNKLKYIILTFIITFSFFMFSKASVQAVEIQDEQGNVFFDLEQISLNGENGYSLIGVKSVASCETGHDCYIEEVVIPDHYEEQPIIAIGNGDYNNLKGAFSGLDKWTIGKISGGNNLLSVGECSFCKANVLEINISGSVVLLNNYAFAKSTVEKIYINRYAPSGSLDVLTKIEGSTFDDINGYFDIVFKTKTVYDIYKNSALWENLSSVLTYSIDCFFYDGEELISSLDCYYKRELGDLPASLTKPGFDFLGWYYIGGTQAQSDDLVFNSTEENGTMVTGLYSKWGLSAPTLSIDAYYDGVVLNNKSMPYSGKNEKMDIVVFVDHLLNVSVQYEWESVVAGMHYDLDNVQNVHSIGFVNESGTYNCYVSISYGGYERKDFLSIDVAILKRALVVNFENKTVNYGDYAVIDNFFVDESTPLAGGDFIKGFVPVQYTNNGENIGAGTYQSVLGTEIKYIGSEDSNFIKNYDITYNKGDLRVVPKILEIEFGDKDDVYYGDEEIFKYFISDSVYITEDNEEGITNAIEVDYIRETPEIKDVGTYRVLDVSTENPNYDLKLKSSDKNVYFIKPKLVDVNWVSDVNMIYDGTEKKYSAYYINNDSQHINLDVVIRKDGEAAKLINAGVYDAFVDETNLDKNYSLNHVSEVVEIEKADSYFVGKVKNQTVSYNGQKQSVEAYLNHSEGKLVFSSGSDCVSAGEYRISVTVEETANYKAITSNMAESEFRLIIKPKVIHVEPNLFKFDYQNVNIGDGLIKIYDGVEYFNEATNKFVVEKIKVKFFRDESIRNLNVGFYNIVNASLDGAYSRNYSIVFDTESGKNKLQIIPSPINVQFNSFDNMVYDGKQKNITVKITGIENYNLGECNNSNGSEFNECIKDYFDLQTYFSDNKVPVNAGDYRLNVNLGNANYYIENANYYDFTISKATYDVSNLKLNSKKVSFDFKSHIITLEGDLPAGLNVAYTIDGNKGNGTLLPFKHTVKVEFIGDYENYNYVDPLTATLNVSLTWVWITLAIVILALTALIFLVVFLVKEGKFHFYKKISKRRFRQIIKKNRQIDIITEMIRNKKQSLVKEDEQIVVEEEVRFVKTPDTERADIVDLSFVDEMFKSSKETKYYYSEVKNELLSYEGVVDRIKRDYETFYLNNMPIAKLDVEKGCLYGYFALDPTLYKTEEYKHEDVKKNKEFAAVPLKLRIDTIESLRHAKMFIRIIRKRENVKSVSNFVRMDYARIYTAKDESFRMFKKVFGKDKKENAEGNRRNLAVCVALSIVTLGIYSIYWNIKINDEMLSLSKTKGPSGAKVVLLSLVTCGIYGLIWLYKMGECVDKVNGGVHSNTKILYLLLGLCGLGIVDLALIQSIINKKQ